MWQSSGRREKSTFRTVTATRASLFFRGVAPTFASGAPYYIYIYIYIYVCYMSIYIHIYIHREKSTFRTVMATHASSCFRGVANTFASGAPYYIYIYIYIYICMCVCVCIHIYVCMYVYIYYINMYMYI